MSGGVHRDVTRTIRWYHVALRSAFHPLLGLVLGSACAPSAPLPVAGSGSAAAPIETPAATEPRSHAPEVAPWLGRARDWPVVSDSPLPSAHLGRLHRAQIRVNPEARAAYLALVTDSEFPDGTWLVEFLKEARTGAAGPTFALERRAGSWVYWQLDAKGGVLAEGALPLCAGCHAGAPASPVFGPARTSPAQESNDAAARSLK